MILKDETSFQIVDDIRMNYDKDNIGQLRE